MSKPIVFGLLNKTTNKFVPSKEPPKFLPKNSYKARSLDMNTLTMGREHTVKEPARILCAHTQFRLNAIDEAAPMASGSIAVAFNEEDSAKYLAMRQEIDMTIKNMETNLREFSKQAAARARKVRLADCVNAPTPAQ